MRIMIKEIATGIGFGIGGLAAIGVVAYLTRKWWLPLISSVYDTKRVVDPDINSYIRKEMIQKLSYEHIVKSVENAILEGNLKAQNNGKAMLVIMPNKNALEYYNLTKSHGQPFFIKDEMTDDEKSKMVVVLITNSTDMSDIFWGKVFVPEIIADDLQDFIVDNVIYTKVIEWDANEVKSNLKESQNSEAPIDGKTEIVNMHSYVQHSGEKGDNPVNVGINDDIENDSVKKAHEEVLQGTGVTLKEQATAMFFPINRDFGGLDTGIIVNNTFDDLISVCKDNVWEINKCFTVAESLSDYISDVMECNPNCNPNAVFVSNPQALYDFLENQEKVGRISEDDQLIFVKNRLKSAIQNGENLIMCREDDSVGNIKILGAKFIKASLGFEKEIQKALDSGMIYEKKIKVK